MPNIGKSTLFNALTNSSLAAAENYPFCTIEPNKAKVPVPDPRLHQLGAIAESQKIIEAQLEFVDIAGLVKGASEGSGLGNKFLDNIARTSLILHAVRCFEDPDILHVENRVDSVGDLHTIRSELILRDFQVCEKRLDTCRKQAKGPRNEKQALAEKTAQICEVVLGVMDNDQFANTVDFSSHFDNSFLPAFKEMFSVLLTAKPMVHLLHCDEDEVMDGNEHTAKLVSEIAELNGGHAVEGEDYLLVSPRLELQASEFAAEDGPEAQLEYLELQGLTETGLARIIRSCRARLGLMDFYTVGPKEARAWTIREGQTAANAAGVIHSDFEKYFIRAETIFFDDFVTYDGEKGAKAAGKMTSNGRDYVCQNGDIYKFLHGA